MATIAYGTMRHYLLASIFEEFKDASEIRKTYFQYDNIVIIDDAVENIIGLDSLINFSRALNPNVKFVLLYENDNLKAYEDLFDVSHRILLSALDMNLAEKIVSGLNAKDNLHELLKETSEYLELNEDVINPLYDLLPTVLPDNIDELIVIINRLADAILSSAYTTRRVLAENVRIKEALNKLLRYRDGLVSNTLLTKKVNKVLAEDNVYLGSFKEKALLANPRYKDNIVFYRNTEDQEILTIHIKEVDGFLFTKKFLELLTMKITYSLGLPTKFYILDDLSTRGSYSDLTVVHDVYTLPTLYKSIGLIKVGYSQQFMEEIYNDKSSPKVIILYNTIAGLDIETSLNLNYYAVKGNPKRYPSLTDLEEYTITNYPGYEMSYSYSPDFKKLQSEKYTKDFLLQLPVFNLMLHDIKDTLKHVELEKKRKLMEQTLD